MEKLVGGQTRYCGERAPWRHPRYPTGAFCDECKEILAGFLTSNWTRVEDEVSPRHRRLPS